MLKIWGRTNSINVQKVLWCCGELGLEYERTDAGMQFGVNNTPEYKAMNPNGLVPTIDEDGFILYESNAIVRYLAGRYSRGSLWPRAGPDFRSGCAALRRSCVSWRDGTPSKQLPRRRRPVRERLRLFSTMRGPRRDGFWPKRQDSAESWRQRRGGSGS